MTPKLTCPAASYGPQMRIHCSRRENGFCVYQYFKACRGWWVLNDSAAQCRLRRKEENYDTR